MTLGLQVDDSLESYRRKITPAAVVSLIKRTALNSKTFNDIPEDVLNDLIRRLEVKEE